MNRIIKILMDRDGLTKEEAIDVYKDVMNDVNYYINNGAYESAEMAFENEFGLELDYFPF